MYPSFLFQIPRHVSALPPLHLLPAGGSVGGPDHDAVCCKGVPSGGSGALPRIHYGAALTGELCGVGLLTTDSDTALAGGPSILPSLPHSKATRCAFSGAREGLRFKKITIRFRENSLKDRIRQQAHAEAQQAHKPKNSKNPQYPPPSLHDHME